MALPTPERQQMLNWIAPALDILWSMKLEVQQHECVYRPKLMPAIDGLLRILEQGVRGMKPTGIIIHHSLTKDGKTVDWDGIKRYHMETNGWADIGYHAGVERISGQLTALTGRPLNMTGGHCLGHNDTIGICVVGNFDLAPPDDETLRYAAALTAGYLHMFPELTVSDIHRHHEYAAKSCPGTQFPWDRFIGLVQEAL